MPIHSPGSPHLEVAPPTSLPRQPHAWDQRLEDPSFSAPSPPLLCHLGKPRACACPRSHSSQVSELSLLPGLFPPTSPHTDSCEWEGPWEAPPTHSDPLPYGPPGYVNIFFLPCQNIFFSLLTMQKWSSKHIKSTQGEKAPGTWKPQGPGSPTGQHAGCPCWS